MTARDFARHALDVLTPWKRCLFIAPTMSGKSNAILDLSAYLKTICRGKGVPIDFSLVFSKTEGSNFNFGGTGEPDDYRLVPYFLARDDMDLELLEAWMTFQKKAKESGHFLMTLVIVDDMLCDPKLVNNKVFMELLQNSRNFGANVILTAHAARQLGPKFKLQFRLIFIGNIGNKAELGKMYEDYGGQLYGTKADFIGLHTRIMRKGKYHWMVLDLDAPREEQAYYWLPRKYAMRDNDGKMGDGLKVPHLCALDFWVFQRECLPERTRMDKRVLFDLERLRGGHEHAGARAGAGVGAFGGGDEDEEAAEMLLDVSARPRGGWSI